MISILTLSILTIVLFILVGLPLTAFLFDNKKEIKLPEFVLIIAFSLIIGFGISAFSASLAYSFFGLNFYFLFLLGFGSISWLIFFSARKKIKLEFKGIFPATLFLFALALYFSKNQWDENLKPRIFSAIGPDVSQNLLAASAAPNLGSTWFESTNYLINSLGVKNLSEAAAKMFEIPSFVNLASVDYLVFGVRWGLTVPFNQILNLFGPETIMHEIGFVLTTVLVTILIIGIAIFRVLKFNYFLSICGAILLALNGSFLNQYYNGGISQAFGLIGNFGLLLILILILSESELLSTKLNRHAIFFISLMAWNASAISYVDATLVVAILLVLLTLSLTLFARKYVLSLSVLMLLPGFCTLIINPIFVYSIVKNLTFRFDANLNTGLKTGNWRLPTQNLGFLPSYTEFAEAQSSLTKFLALTIFVIILIVMFVVTFTNLRLNASFIILMWCSSLVCLIGYLLAQSSKGRSDYLYNKVTTYIAPFFVVSFLYLIKTNEIKFVKPIKSSFIISLTFVVLISSVQVEYAFSKSRAFTTILPNPYGEIMQNKKIKMYLESNNYILPYKAAYNFTGLLGVKYWISKAPNDYNLEIEDRINRPLLLLCFKGDNICEPKTKKINHQLSPELSKYGIVEYESELSTSEYSKLSIRERYAYAFSIMGTEPVEIPERYVGGNPYLK